MPGFDHERFIPILKDIRELLLKHDFLAQADVVSRLIDLGHLESPDFVETLQSGLVWGSAGSVDDVVFSGNVAGPQEQIRRDDVEYRRLFVRLGTEMDAQGILRERERTMVEGYKRFLPEEDQQDSP